MQHDCGIGLLLNVYDRGGGLVPWFAVNVNRCGSFEFEDGFVTLTDSLGFSESHAYLGHVESSADGDHVKHSVLTGGGESRGLGE